MTLRIFVFAGLLVAASAPAHADLPDEIQVYDDDLNPRGVFGVELHLNHTIEGQSRPSYPGEVVTGGATRITPEFSYGLGGGFEAGLYVNGLVDRFGTPRLAGAKARLKWIGRAAPVDEAGRGGLFYGVNVEVGRIGRQYEIGRWGVELRPIVGWRNADWTLIANPILDWTLAGPAGSATPVFSPGAKVSRRVGDGVAVGIEAYRDFGAITGFEPARRQATQVFAVVDVTRGRLPFNLGIGRGFGGADRWTVKAILELPF